MDKGGSVRRTRLPAPLAPVIVLAGMAAMLLVVRPAFVLGLRPALLLSETALVVPGLLAPVLAHALVNTITFAAAPFTDDPAGGLPAPRPLLGLALLTAGAAFTMLLMRRVDVVDSPRAGA